MAFWSAETVERQLPHLVICGRADRIKHGAYELSLGKEVFITSENVKRRLAPGEQVAVPPGQMALLLTDEFVQVPKDAMALLSIKSTHKLRGLINVSGFHVDPGFCGHLVFAVYNAGPNPVPLTRGAAVFLIWYASLDRETDRPYAGSHLGQDSITDSMVREMQGQIASPAALQQRMNEIQASFEATRWFAAFIGLFLGAAFSGILIPVVQEAIRWSQAGRLATPHLALSFVIGLGVAFLCTWALRSVLRGQRHR